MAKYVPTKCPLLACWIEGTRSFYLERGAEDGRGKSRMEGACVWGAISRTCDATAASLVLAKGFI